MTVRRLVPAWIAIASIALSGCNTYVRLAPRSFAWRADGSEATWRSGGVTVVAHLNTEVAEFPVTGSIRARGPGAGFAFTLPGVQDGTTLGEIRSTDPPAPIVAGTWYPVPPAGVDGWGSLSYALRPDVAWTDLPEVESGVTYVLLVRGADGEAQCPFRFRVESSAHRLKPVPAVVATIVLLPVFLVVVVVFVVLAQAKVGDPIGTLPRPY